MLSSLDSLSFRNIRKNCNHSVEISFHLRVSITFADDWSHCSNTEILMAWNQKSAIDIVSSWVMLKSWQSKSAKLNGWDWIRSILLVWFGLVWFDLVCLSCKYFCKLKSLNRWCHIIYRDMNERNPAVVDEFIRDPINTDVFSMCLLLQAGQLNVKSVSTDC